MSEIQVIGLNNLYNKDVKLVMRLFRLGFFQGDIVKRQLRGNVKEILGYKIWNVE